MHVRMRVHRIQSIRILYRKCIASSRAQIQIQTEVKTNA